MSSTAIDISPFNCRWIAPTPEGRSADSHYAICTRPPRGPRVVNEPECALCKKWEAAETEAPKAPRH